MSDIVVSLAPRNRVRYREAINRLRIRRRGGHVIRTRPGKLGIMADTTIVMKGPTLPAQDVTISNIPNIFISEGEDFDMSQFIIDPQNLRSTSRVVGLSGNATYDPVSELLTGVSDGVETNLVLEVDF